MDKFFKYYSIERPVSPGTYPKKEHVKRIENFSEKKQCADICMEAWGFLIYDEPLSEKEAKEYDLISDELKTYYAVTTAVYDDGHIVCNITDTIQSVLKPQNRQKCLKMKEIYIEWFGSWKEANAYVLDSRNC